MGDSSITDKVSRGSSLLDQLEPGWASRVDLARLDVGDVCNCVIGQLHGDYNNHRGLVMMNAITADLFAYSEGDFGRHFGFMADTYIEADKLTGAWRKEITKRLQPPQEQHGE